MAAKYITLHLTPNDLQLVHQFMRNHVKDFRLGAMNGEDEYLAFEILARVIRQVRGLTLREIVDSHKGHIVHYV
ncbi:hypothetical protein TSUD_321450 [Trifolium subterraneum]|uniref:Uncharacterized protein n=1 Tax=Trifolium subterraneum TaxID=3900 RepID=A0A2Z6N2K3_TRISU|nr:hypothetical protein TSUD_321450 [Trifolium subterraneum]